MALQNRVTPLGELIADPSRGLVYGNRGCLHDADRGIRRPYAGKRWIACRLAFRGWHRAPLMQPGRFTELFFLDEATAFAAGHRPCALCRREDYGRFMEIWSSMHRGERGADALDAQLHRERLDLPRGMRRLHAMSVASLPDGAFVLRDGTPFAVVGSRLLRWTPSGYAQHLPRATRGRIAVVTPPSIVEVLRRGWEPDVPFLHPSASGTGMSTTGGP